MLRTLEGRRKRRGYRSTPSADPGAGLTTKLHLACDGPGRPLGFVVTGQVGNFTGFEQVMGAAIRYRFDKTSKSYQATLTIAALRRWGRTLGKERPRP